MQFDEKLQLQVYVIDSILVQVMMKTGFYDRFISSCINVGSKIKSHIYIKIKLHM